MEYYDISPEISENTAVFPGDAPFQRTVALDFKTGGNLLLSSISTTVHIGAHTDAPNHYHKDGVSIELRDLNFYLGPCQVVSVKCAPNQRIRPEHIQNLSVSTQRILFKTGSYPNPNQWNGDFNALSAELINYLAQKGVRLVGIDTPSVDPSDDKALEAHNAIYKNDMAILEGIVLQEVPDGTYTLIALPLKVKGADATPVRAVLLKDIVWKK